MVVRCIAVVMIALLPLAGCSDAGARATHAPAVALRGRANGEVGVLAARAPRARPSALGARRSATATGEEQAAGASTGALEPDEMGRIPILEYHLLGDHESRWTVDREHFRRSLQWMYDRGYRPVSVSQLVDRKIDLPRGLSPVVYTFDDASPSQFSYIEKDGKLEIDPNSAVGIWLDFAKTHPGWGNHAVFCMLPAAAAGHAFFGDKGIDGQKTAWRFQKVRFLAEQGFELCDHTLWHAQLNKYPDAFVQEQIARGQMAIDSAVPGYRVRTFALPQGLWPKNKALAWQGSWRDPKSGKVIAYHFDGVLEVAGGPTRSPYDPQFDPHHLFRVEVFGQELERTIEKLDRSGNRYVSDGNPNAVARKGTGVAAATR